MINLSRWGCTSLRERVLLRLSLEMCEPGWFLGLLSGHTCRLPVFEVFALCLRNQHWNLTCFSWQSSVESILHDADTCCKPYVVGSSNIKIQDVSQIKLLICITNQV